MSGPILQLTLLVSLDVISLYANIPHEDDIHACREVWDNRSIKVLQQRHCTAHNAHLKCKDVIHDET